MTTPTEIREPVERVLRASENHLTAYQILARLPQPLRDTLLSERGAPGAGGGRPYSAVSVVSQAAQMLCAAGLCETVYLDGRGIHFEVGGDLVQAGDAACACYRMRRE